MDHAEEAAWRWGLFGIPRAARDVLTRNLFQHLHVGRKFLHEHEETLDRFFRFVTGQATANQVDFLQLPRLQQQLLAPRAGKENIDRRINALIADLSVE